MRVHAAESYMHIKMVQWRRRSVHFVANARGGRPRRTMACPTKLGTTMLVGGKSFGGRRGDRTPDLCIANAALSQLS
jgi:hypothetical protein